MSLTVPDSGNVWIFSPVARSKLMMLDPLAT